MLGIALLAVVGRFLHTGRRRGPPPDVAPAEHLPCPEHPAPWRSGYAAACKAVYTGSIPVGASEKSPATRGFGRPRKFERASMFPQRGRGVPGFLDRTAEFLLCRRLSRRGPFTARRS